MALTLSIKHEGEKLISDQIQLFQNAANMDDRDILEYHLRHYWIMKLFQELDRTARFGGELRAKKTWL